MMGAYAAAAGEDVLFDDFFCRLKMSASAMTTPAKAIKAHHECFGRTPLARETKLQSAEPIANAKVIFTRDPLRFYMIGLPVRNVQK
jgi:hypothetical protein